MLLYTNAVLLLLQSLFLGGLGFLLLIFIVGQVAGALGIANEKKAGYYLAAVCALAPVALTVFLIARYHVLAVNIFSVLFEIALVVALFHPMSRSYRKIWFR
ncbi:MAG: hypothetical protein M0Z69_02885 [Actinomycetota bacterium]|nr:hypothetical protein [Actinomycetota bacterium]